MGCYLSRETNIKSQKKKIKKIQEISEEEIEVKSDSNESELSDEYIESKLIFISTKEKKYKESL